MADAAAAEELGECAVVGVGPGVVADQPLRLDSLAGEEGECTLDEADDGAGAFIAVQFGVGEPGMVVDDGVHELPADAQALVGAGPVASARDGVAGSAEAAEALAVDVEQIAGARPLITARLLTRRMRAPRQTGAAERTPDGRMCMSGLAGDQAWSP